MTSLVVSAQADLDIDAIYRRLQQEAGLQIAAEYDRRFDALFVRLLEFPQSGSLKPVLGAKMRIGVVHPYIIVYTFDEGTDRIDVLRILHGRRKIASSLMPAAGPA